MNSSPIISRPLVGKHFVVESILKGKVSLLRVEVLGLVPGEFHTYRVLLPNGEEAVASDAILKPVH